MSIGVIKRKKEALEAFKVLYERAGEIDTTLEFINDYIDLLIKHTHNRSSYKIGVKAYLQLKHLVEDEDEEALNELTEMVVKLI